MPSGVIPPNQFDRDRDHLKMLVIMHYVFGVLSIASLGFLYFHFQFMKMVVGGQSVMPEMPAVTVRDAKAVAEIFSYLWIIYLVLGAACVLSGVLCFLSARFLSRTRNRTFSQVVGALCCLQIPIGTALGVFTLIVLGRDSVRVKYERAALMSEPPGLP